VRRRRNRAAATLIGALAVTLGGCTGSLLGGGDPALYGALGETDVALATTALQDGLETRPNHAAETWHNPSSGHAGSITPRATLVSDTGSFCRRYDEHLTLADGRSTTLTNTACRDEDGRWIGVS
jgi:surface antigen